MSIIPQTDIAIDGATAWLAVRNHDRWFWETEHNRPCDTCDGSGHVRKRLHDAPGIHRPVTCTDCHGTGRHAFTLNTSEIFVAGDGENAIRIETLTVHVVDVLPIYTWEQSRFSNVAHISRGPHVVGSGLGKDEWVYYPAGWQDGQILESVVTLPAIAAPGMWAVHLAIHKEEA
jgi:hypothetical protein